MLHKTFDLLETKTDSETGTFEATVAVFGNVDRGGDRIMPGAFKNTITRWQDSGDPIPVILSHQWDNPMAHIGVVDEIKETDAGLWVKGSLDVGDNDVARQVHKLMKRRSLKEFSFGYEVAKNGSKRAKDGALDLTELDLAEVGPTLKGMNPATELHAVKTALEAEQPALADTTVTELQEIKARLDTLEKTLEDLKSKADMADGQPKKADSVDPLRKQARETALRVLSAGIQPPQQAPVQEPLPEPEMDPAALRKHSRDLIVHILSGGNTPT